jgi:hypothetical protein
MSERSPFRPALVIGLITAGLLSFAAFILLLGWGKPEGESGQLSGSAPSVAAVGFAGIAELSGEFFPTRWSKTTAISTATNCWSSPSPPATNPNGWRSSCAGARASRPC